MDIVCGANQFETFIRNVIANPGIVERYYNIFIKPYKNYKNLVIGKQENLCEDFIHFLMLAKENFHPAWVRALPPTHVSKGNDMNEWTTELLEQIYMSERHLFKQYDYQIEF